MIKNLVDLVTLVLLLAPPIIKLTTALAQKAHNTKLENLMARADIIVQALEQTGLASADKKNAAVEKLNSYAKEVGIKITADQLDDYVEAAVRIMNTTK